ncbi:MULTISPECIES: sugar transferase [Sphingobium]|jgi:exopolysaccharide biosynthesis polyprenyl glycosylphosphotransferase|uniref:Exopolysaccharide biosynthesis polyprenyl glycosylphosphotransferase n=2 Tax=Sphingobium yanoikuyae TaxID=13690 RepID=K9CM06_SPHYA|nr:MULTISPECIES: sugar transferase [Sphingobium]EKU72898.1 exopolysaccharide biosynthesis polyprenyl glycosylphosphotransferase [Sphingobium yanoikuyae ATCC 51230]OAH41314.1 sugar transferase [Sphingobium yanoikuyae]WQE08551.1 sugar transferase [Sphingobium yanoikuyae]SHL50739.1 exopolysaccharide biosynthesis polyprenyl glycosylphosphotransferase [Sphingobium sp. YR657]
MIMQGASLTVSKEIVRLRLYALCLAGDMAGLFIAFLLANWLVVGAFLGEPGKPHGLVMFSMVAPLYAILAVQGGAYGINTLDRVRRGIFRALLALAQAALLMLLIVYLGKIAEQLSRLTFLTGLLLGAATLALVRLAVARLAVRLLGDVPHLTAVIMDGVAIETGAHMEVIQADAANLHPERHDADMAARLAAAVGMAERVIVACPLERMDDWSAALKSLSARGEIVVPELLRFAPARVDEFDGQPTIIVAGGPLQFRDRLIKRLFDIIVATIATIALSPVLFGAALAVKLTSPGPILFRQPRIGKDGRPFSIYKFRSMRTEASDHKAATLTKRDDDRVTRVGAFLRKTSIDELPQLFNVLNGDMSVVGPRPHAAAAKAGDSLYWEVDARYWERHCIKPGMTGLAQVRGHRGATDHHQDLIDRLQSDLEYVSDWSIWRDLRIIVATLGVLVHHKAY